MTAAHVWQVNRETPTTLQRPKWMVREGQSGLPTGQSRATMAAEQNTNGDRKQPGRQHPKRLTVTRCCYNKAYIPARGRAGWFDHAACPKTLGYLWAVQLRGMSTHHTVPLVGAASRRWRQWNIHAPLVGEGYLRGLRSAGGCSASVALRD
jgi:hypothetical protein